MINRRMIALASTTLAGVLAAGSAFAQSTGTAEVDELVVTGAKGPATIDGAMVVETAPKSRYTITQDFIARQADGQTILQTLNLVPGLVFMNNDAYGSSGGSTRLHGQDSAHIGLLIDGVPLNDAGNYASYSNQQSDPEVIEQANVNTGSTDADTVTASATAGVIQYTTLKATKERGLTAKAALGTDNYHRLFVLAQTGEFGPYGTRGWVSASYQNYDKFKGLGDLTKKQFNARIEQDLGKEGDFVALNLQYNENRNTFYYQPYLGTATGSIASEVSQYGWDVDYNTAWTQPTAVAGSVDTVPTGNSSTFLGYYGLRVNPSNTGTVRGQGRFTLAPNLKLTVDPSFNYTLANGGGSTNMSETGFQVVGASGAGVDLNGDGDTRDTVQLYSPSNTNTRRYGLNTSLIWDMSDHHRLRLAYAYDEGHTRQTGEYSTILGGYPSDVFSGKDGYGEAILSADGAVAQKRDRLSIATFKQWSLEYRGEFLDERLVASLGVRLPTLDRELHQYCYSQAGSSTAYCTTRTPTTTAALADGAVAQVVTFGTSTTKYFTPFSAERSYDDVLPNVGLSYRIGEAHTVFANYAEQMSAPKVDNLYTLTSTGELGSAEPETGKTVEVGYRFRSPRVMASASVYQTDIENRIVSTRDPTDDTYIDRNVGAVKIKGVDAQVQAQFTEAFAGYFSAAYTDAKLQDDLFISTALGYAATKGKQVVETPEWTFAGRLTYDIGPVALGVQAKYVGERWATDVNDLKVDAFTVVDIDVRYDLAALGWKNSYVQLNVTNLFDEQYYSVLSGTTTSATPGAAGYAQPYAYVGAPRAAVVSLKTSF